MKVSGFFSYSIRGEFKKKHLISELCEKESRQFSFRSLQDENKTGGIQICIQYLGLVER